MNVSAVNSIETGLSLSSAADDGSEIANTIRRQLGADGYTFIQRSKRDRLAQLLSELYVDKRKENLVARLEEARKIASSI
jgi:hypothetical protein